MHISLVPEISTVFARVFKIQAALHILHLVAHPFTHHKRTALLHRHITREAGMTAQFKNGILPHGHVHGCICIMPIIRMRVTPGRRRHIRTQTMHRIRAG